MLREAIEAARHAVELRPREPRYCNNLAALLVEAGRPQEAFKQLREIYDEPVAHYDLGFLLNKRGMKAAALQEFTIALRLSPGMAAAREWVTRLSRERGESPAAMIGMRRRRDKLRLRLPRTRLSSQRSSVCRRRWLPCRLNSRRRRSMLRRKYRSMSRHRRSIFARHKTWS